jgi:ferredoxin, 2Fe-2S
LCKKKFHHFFAASKRPLHPSSLIAFALCKFLPSHFAKPEKELKRSCPQKGFRIKFRQSFLLRHFMPKVQFIQADGESITVDVPVGTSLLEAAHQYDVDLEGACEGSLSCSTCHVIVNPEWYDQLNEPLPEEDDMLDLAFGLTKYSRLGCQIVMRDDLDGLTVRIPSGTRNLGSSFEQKK